MARALGSYPKGRGFKSNFRYHDNLGCHAWPGGQAAKTPPFHGGNTGSIPVRVTTKRKGTANAVPFLFVRIGFGMRALQSARNLPVEFLMVQIDAPSLCEALARRSIAAKGGVPSGSPYPSRRLGMESMRLRIVWNRRRRMSSHASVYTYLPAA